MKISVDDQELFTLSDTKKNVIRHEINADIFEDDMKRRVQWVLMHKYERCMDRLKREWVPKLQANGVSSIPLDNDALAELIFSQPNYEDRKARMVREEAERGR